jgi:energy-coupling factor transporter ATP-binding protein EcfA2
MKEITPNIQINIEDFRAVNKANIIIDGITVVAGENGCGKSSISKLIYFLYKTVSNYEVLAKKKLVSDLGNIVRFFDILQQELRLNIKERKSRDDFRREIYELRRNLINSEYLKDELSKWLNIVERFEEVYIQSNIEPSERFRHNAVRFNYIINDILNNEINGRLKNEDIDNDIYKSFAKIKIFIKNNFDQAIKKIKTRPTSLF